MERTRRCAWCGRPFAVAAGPGRPRRYCKASHRQRAYEARKAAERRGIGPDEIVLSRAAWERLRDALYALEAASSDVALDLAAGRPTRADYVEALAHLTEAVRGLQDISLEPHAVGGGPELSP